MNKSKKIHVAKDSETRTKDVLDFVRTDTLESINPEVVNGHRYAFSYLDSIRRYQKVYFLKTKDDAIEKVRHVFADIGKPGTLVCGDADEINLNQIKQLCIKQGLRIELSALFTSEENGKVECD